MDADTKKAVVWLFIILIAVIALYSVSRWALDVVGNTDPIIIEFQKPPAPALVNSQALRVTPHARTGCRLYPP